MYIAVCDDHEQERMRIAGVLQAFAEARGATLRYQLYGNAETMLREAQSRRFTHYILDIMMPCMDGMTAAQEIRIFDREAKIVFVTSFQEYAYQSYRVRAEDYLLKPVEPRQLTEWLERWQAQEDSEERCIFVQNGHFAARIPLSKLACVEVYQKKLHFHLKDGQVRQSAGTMAQIEKELLPYPGFIKAHRSYIVNLNQVAEMSADGCLLFSGKRVPVSRMLYQQVRGAYMTHLFGGTGV